MNKEKLNKILPYSGHGLKAIYEGDIVNVGISTSGTHMIPFERLYDNHYRPILFSPNCLTKGIETEYGKEIPIVEIAKIMGFEGKLDEELQYGWNAYVCDDYQGYVLSVSGTKLLIRYDDLEGPIVEEIPVSYEALQYFYSRHIAFNLDPKDYVCVESLGKNPYAKCFL